MVDPTPLISITHLQESLFEVIGEGGDSDEDLSAMLHRLQVTPSENNIIGITCVLSASAPSCCNHPVSDIHAGPIQK